MRLSICVGVAAAVFALASPAAATNWQGDGWFFADQDSITRSGDIVSVNEADCHGAGDGDGVDIPTSECSFSQMRLNCATGEKRNMTTGQTYMLEAWTATMQIYCPRKPAAAARPATPAATKSAPNAPAAPTKAAKSDVKTCDEYNPDPKVRIAACTRIIDSANPGFADLVTAHYNRCRARSDAKDKPDAALADCTRAMTLDPKSYDAIETRGNVNQAAGRFDAAIADYTQAIALDPKRTGAYFDRAQSYVSKKDVKNAVADFTAMRNVNPNANEGQFRLMLCWVRGHLNAELEIALSDCESAVRLMPKSAYGYQKRGIVHLRMGNLKEARADETKALAVDPKNAWALYARAIVNAREGKTMASYDDMAAAKKSSPDLVVKDYNEMGLKLMVQAENAPFCPALTSLIKAAGERAASKAKADVAMPGATYCAAIEGGYVCRWLTGEARAPARQTAIATAAATCLSGYTRKDSASNFGPSAEFAQGKTKITIATTYDLKASAVDGAAVAVAIVKPEPPKAGVSKPTAPKPPAISEQRLRMLQDGCPKKIFSPQECKAAGIGN